MAALIGNQYAPDDNGQASQQAQNEYVTPASDYMANALKDTFVGSGSYFRKVQQDYINNMGGDPIHEDQWNPSNPLYDKRIRYYDGLTTDKAKAITQLNDEDANRAIAREKASTAVGVVTLPARLIANLFEPLQAVELGATVLAGAATGGLADAPIIGARVAALSEALAASPAAVRIGASAIGEGALFTASTVPAQLYSASTMGQDYTAVDFLKEFGMNTLFIGGVHGAFKGYKALRGGADIELDPKTFDNINDQIKAGVAPNVEGATSANIAEQKAAVQSRLDVLQRQKDSRTDFESAQRDQIESLQTQKLAVENGLDGIDPARVPTFVDAIKKVKEGGDGAIEAKEYLDQNGINVPDTKKPEPLPSLPVGLSRSSPRYGQSVISFASDVDRALYVVREESANKSNAHEKFVDFLENKVGMSAEEIKSGSRAVAAAIKEQGKAARGGDFKLEQVYKREESNLAPGAAEKIKAIESKIGEINKNITGPDSLSDLREKIKIHQDRIAQFPTDETLTSRATAEISRRLDPKNQSTYRSVDLDFAARPAVETKAETAAREIIDDGMKHEETANAIASVDADYEVKLKALDVAVKCLGR